MPHWDLSDPRMRPGVNLVTRSNMLTDNWPVDFTYISRRIVKEIVQQHEAGRSGHAHKIGLTGSIALGPFSPGVSFESSKRPVDYDNYFDLAKRATAVVSDHTGWLARDKPDRIPTGPYVHAKIHMQVQKVPLSIWERVHNHPIAAFAGIETVPGIGRVFIGLAGSASNFLHVNGGPSTATRTPSDAVGIYDIIQQNRELTANGILEPGISADELAAEFEYCHDDETRFQEAISLFDACGLSEPSTLLEMLIRVHHRNTNMDFDLYAGGGSMGTFDLVILGAPVWVSSVEPEQDKLVPARHLPLQRSESSGADDFWRSQLDPRSFYKSVDSSDCSFAQDQGKPLCPDTGSPVLHEKLTLKRTRSWAVFDAQLREYLAAISRTPPDCESTARIHLAQWPPSRTRWREFGEWFVSIASRLGPDPEPFSVPLSTHPLNVVHPKRSTGATGELLRYGWFIGSAPLPFPSFPNYDLFNIIVLVDGTVWTTFDDRSRWSTSNVRQVLRSGSEREVAAASIFWAIARWRTLMTNDDKVPRIEIASKHRRFGWSLEPVRGWPQR